MTYERLPYDEASTTTRDDLRRRGPLRAPSLAVPRSGRRRASATRTTRTTSPSRASRSPRRPPGWPRRSTPTWTDRTPRRRPPDRRRHAGGCRHDPRPGRWLAPLGASAAVLAVFVVPGWSPRRAQRGAAPGRPRTWITPHDPVTPTLPPDGAEEDRSGRREVDLVGYRADGAVLHVFYTVDPRRGCSVGIDEPVVDERVGSVRIRLLRSWPGPGSVGAACADRLPTSSVDIRLSRPLGGRLLQDGARGGLAGAAQLAVPALSHAPDGRRPPLP